MVEPSTSSTFLLGPPGASIELSLGIVLSLLLVGAALTGFALRLDKTKRSKLLAAGIVLLVVGGFVLYFTNPFEQNSMTVGNGWVSATAPPYFDLNITTTQIAHAYVVDLNSWNVSIAARDFGTSFGSFHSGFFTLSNGARADVLSDGEVNLVLILKTGTYVILGPSQFQAFSADFGRRVDQTTLVS